MRNNLGAFLSRNWQLLIFRGILSILFGIAVFAWPDRTLVALTLLIGGYALVDGVLAMYHAVSHRQDIENWGWLLVEGALSVLFGILVFRTPGLAAAINGFFAAFVVAAWSIATGTLRVVAAFRLRNEIDGEWILGISGVLSILFGWAVLLQPQIGILSILWLMGFWAVLIGILTILLALRVKDMPEHPVMNKVLETVESARR